MSIVLSVLVHQRLPCQFFFHLIAFPFLQGGATSPLRLTLLLSHPGLGPAMAEFKLEHHFLEILTFEHIILAPIVEQVTAQMLFGWILESVNIHRPTSDIKAPVWQR